jgi:dolichol-phosphate mannosyltransferase
MDLSVVLPAKNEAENLRGLLPQLNEVLSSLSIAYEVLVVVPTTISDDTETVCRENTCTYLFCEGGNRYGDGIRTGIRVAQGTYLVVMDADGSHNPRYIADCYRAIQQGYDCVIGSRYIAGGLSHKEWSLRVMSYMVNIAYQMIYPMEVHDMSHTFKMYRTQALKNISLEGKDFDISEEMLIKVALTVPNFRVLEIPFVFEDRKHGSSKRQMGYILCSYLLSLYRLWRFKKCCQKGRG